MRDFIHIKFSFSGRIQQGYIDFLDSRLTSDQYEGAKFPHTIFMSGEGSYYNPY